MPQNGAQNKDGHQDKQKSNQQALQDAKGQVLNAQNKVSSDKQQPHHDGQQGANASRNNGAAAQQGVNAQSSSQAHPAQIAGFYNACVGAFEIISRSAPSLCILQCVLASWVQALLYREMQKRNLANHLEKAFDEIRIDA